MSDAPNPGAAHGSILPRRPGPAGDPDTAPLTYGAAGVSIDAADEAKARLKRVVESTFTAGARGAFGGFGGMFRLPDGYRRPVLVASADGVGTKVRVAIDCGRYDTVGHDLVNHCVNDILVQGAVPLFFLDYVAFGKLEPAVVEDVVRGVAAGCVENGCALIGGETAEMPGVYTPPDFDLAGFIVGAVEEDRVLGAERVKPSDVLVAFESSGLHTNGYSLARRIVAERLRLAPDDPFPGAGRSTADVLLDVHRSYLAAIGPVLDRVHAMAHITGGGLPGNLGRALPPQLDAVVDTRSWDVPNLFRVMEESGRVERAEMFRAFNMGIGLVAITDRNSVDALQATAASANVRTWVLGHLVAGAGRVLLD